MPRAFFGDRERDFSLTPQWIPELENVTNKAIGAMVDDVRRMSYSEMTQIVRLGLVGAGEHPETADRLVRSYVGSHPLSEVHLLAIDILSELWSGPSAENEAKAA